MAREKVYRMDENDHDDVITKKNNISRTNSFEKFSSDDSSPETSTSVLPELARSDFNEAKKVARVSSCTSPLLFSLRVQALGKLNPIDVNKHLWLHYSHAQAFDNNSTTLDDKNNSQNSNMNESLLDEKIDDSFDRSMSNMALAKESSKGLLVTKPKNSPLPQHPETVATTLPHPQPPPPLAPSKALEPPPLLPSRGAAPSLLQPSPPPKAIGNGGGVPPLPPPLGATISLRPKKTNSKLKRSTQIGNLYRSLKRKVEGTSSNPDGKSYNGKMSGMRSDTSAGKEGMADALAEMRKRSAYFRKIEEDVKKFTNPIMELKSSISSFETKDMDELLKFQKDVESVLENLTDETQVLSRFEGFPTKKLETMRTAAALHTKLDCIITELRNWKIVSPIGQLLDKLERYFDR